MELEWLVDANAKIEDKVNSLDLTNESAWADIRKILACNLSSTYVNKLFLAVSKLSYKSGVNLRMARVKVLFVGSVTLKHIHSDMVIAALRHNVWLEAKFTNFGQIANLAYNSDSDVVEFNPDLIVLFEHSSSFDFLSTENSIEGAKERVEQNLAFARQFSKLYKAQTVLNTVVQPIDAQISDMDTTFPFTVSAQVNCYNQCLMRALPNPDIILFDVESLSAQFGRASWGNTDYFHYAKIPFHPDASAVFSNRLASLFSAYAGKSRRALILDCDNTLWGGVIGDDGIEGISIGQGSAIGEAHTAVQKFALRLREQGVVLCISSKNSHEIAIKAFEDHPDMLLKKEHISVFRINWADKAANISDIAKTLNLGLESFVFLDDNPAERARVRDALPEVAVPDVGKNPNDYPAFIAQAGYFNALSLNAEDRHRADMYAANVQRTKSMQDMDDFGTYLKSLDMQISFNSFDTTSRPRIAQLVSKSNQFNLTTFRYTVGDIAAFENDPDAITLQVRLKDKFGDNGMISVVILERISNDWIVKLWLMSCRVLGRRVEEIVLQYIVDAAVLQSVDTIKGVYVPTHRNAIVKDHYDKLGFKKTAESDDGTTQWSLDPKTHTRKDLPFAVIDS